MMNTGDHKVLGFTPRCLSQSLDREIDDDLFTSLHLKFQRTGTQIVRTWMGTESLALDLSSGCGKKSSLPPVTMFLLTESVNIEMVE